MAINFQAYNPNQIRQANLLEAQLASQQQLIRNSELNNALQIQEAIQRQRSRPAAEANEALNQQLKQLQIESAQRQLIEASKTPQQRQAEQFQANLANQQLAQGGVMQQAIGPVAEAFPISQADQDILGLRALAEAQGGAPATSEGIFGIRPTEFQTEVSGLPGFVQSPALQRQEQQQSFDQLRQKTALTKALEREFETPEERAQREANLAKTKVETAKSGAILDQIENIATRGGKRTNAVYDPTGQSVIAYEYFDPIKGATDLIDIKTPKDAENFKLALDQSNKFDDDPSVKNYSSAISSIRGIQNLSSNPNATAADDTALIFAFMKSIDPRSTVREGEQASVQNSAGIPDRIRNLYNNAVRGNRLTSTQRLEIFGAAEKSVSGLKTGYDLARARFIDKSQRANLDENIVVGPVLDHRAIMREFSGVGGAAPQTVSLPSISTQQQFDALPSGASYLGEDGATYRKP